MYETLKGKRVLVTGGSSGIGAAIALEFAGLGASVGIHYRQNAADAQKVLNKIAGMPGKAQLFQGDLKEINFRHRLVESFVEAFGGIDVLVNNAGGLTRYAHFSRIDEQEWDATYSLNVKAPFILSRNAFKYMQESGGGRIINISTVAVKYVGPSSMHYSSSKAALDILTRGFAREGAPYRILVNSIRCGVIDTPMHTKIEGYNEEDFRKRVGLIPLQRMGQPLDIARMVIFLSSECGDFITGEIFSVAGGD